MEAQTTTKKECIGHLKTTCSGNCPNYQECLEIDMGIQVRRTYF
jgi:hypothetical protein